VAAARTGEGDWATFPSTSSPGVFTVVFVAHCCGDAAEFDDGRSALTSRMAAAAAAVVVAVVGLAFEDPAESAVDAGTGLADEGREPHAVVGCSRGLSGGEPP